MSEIFANFALNPLTMILRPSTGNMYKFITHTWNPIKGKCFHDCSYCYMKKIVPNPTPIKLVQGELTDSFPENSFIFIDSSADLFAKDVPDEWIENVLNFCDRTTQPIQASKRPQFLIQTKNPQRILDFIDHPLFALGRNQVVVCTTIETNRYYLEIMNNAPLPQQRAEAMAKITERGIKTYVTIEPIMDFDLDEMVALIKMCKPEQVNIGRNTNQCVTLPEPTRLAVVNLIFHLICSTKIKIKKNLDGEKMTSAIDFILKENYSFEDSN